MNEQWLCYVYQYGVGGVFFFGSIVLAVKSGAHVLTDRINRSVVAGLVIGYFAFMLIHGLWIASSL